MSKKWQAIIITLGCLYMFFLGVCCGVGTSIGDFLKEGKTIYISNGETVTKIKASSYELGNHNMITIRLTNGTEITTKLSNVRMEN